MNEQDLQRQSTQIAGINRGRRSLLGGAGKAALLGAAAVVLGGCSTLKSRLASVKVGQRCMTILYPNEEGVRFDMEYYKNHHLPLIMDLYGKSIARFELRQGLPGPDGSKPPYVATVHIYIADQKAFDENGAKHGKTLVDDVPNFSSVMPVIQADEVYEVAES